MQIAVALLLTSLTNNVRALQHPEAPAQHCRHDAGPPWADDEENFGNKAYFDGTPAAPKGDCPAPLAAACSAKGKKAAFLDGLVDCGGKGWFCRIMPQAGWVNPDFDDNNFAMCNARDADEEGDEDAGDEEEDEDSGDEDAGDEEEDSYEDDGDECEDDPRWRKHPRKNRRKRHDCDWVAAKARKRCKKKNKTGVRASEACECACA